MKRYLLAAALVIAGPVFAQDTTATPPATDQAAPAPAADPAAAAPAADPAAAAPAPTAMAEPSTKSYPPCSKTVTDSCTSSAGGHATKHRKH